MGRTYSTHGKKCVRGFVGKLEGRRSLERDGCGREDDIKTYVKDRLGVRGLGYCS